MGRILQTATVIIIWTACILFFVFVAGNSEAQTGTYAGTSGTSYHEVGGVTFGSDGTMATQIGNSTFITGGDSGNVVCTEIGGTTFCN